jgi:hypothetical protein
VRLDELEWRELADSQFNGSAVTAFSCIEDICTLWKLSNGNYIVASVKVWFDIEPLAAQCVVHDLIAKSSRKVP